MLYLIRPLERHVRRHLASELNRQRFDRAKRFVDKTREGGGDGEDAMRVHARWLRFLCSQESVQRDMWLEEVAFLRRFATDFGLPPPASREFVNLSLLGELWRAWGHDDLVKGPPELVGRLTRVAGWENFERCRRDGAGLVLLPVHGQFSRLFQPYLRHRGHDGLELGLTDERLERRGFRTPAAKRFELARQMHAARHLLNRGGIVFNAPDARQNLDHSRSVEFFGRQRRLAAGFAELALVTNAHVVPIAYRFSRRGFFVLEFKAPFDVLGPQATHDARVDSLVAQYANFLRDEWRGYPWNIHWDHLRYYCQLPGTDSGAISATGAAAHPPETVSGGAREGFAR